MWNANSHPLKPVRVFLGAVPTMLDSIIRDVLSGSPEIEIVSRSRDGSSPEYDVLLINDTAGWAGTATGTQSGQGEGPPKSGIVIVGHQGDEASVFHRLGREFRLDGPSPQSLEDAIKLAAQGS